MSNIKQLYYLRELILIILLPALFWGNAVAQQPSQEELLKKLSPAESALNNPASSDLRKQRPADYDMHWQVYNNTPWHITGVAQEAGVSPQYSTTVSVFDLNPYQWAEMVNNGYWRHSETEKWQVMFHTDQQHKNDDGSVIEYGSGSETTNTENDTVTGDLIYKSCNVEWRDISSFSDNRIPIKMIINPNSMEIGMPESSNCTQTIRRLGTYKN